MENWCCAGTFGTLAANLGMSLVYSLGSVRDREHAVLWPCEAQPEGGEGWGAWTTCVKQWMPDVGGMKEPRWWVVFLFILANQG